METRKEITQTPIEFTSVMLRDGEQQAKREAVMPIADRLAVFDLEVGIGIRRIEIGHLANEHDQELATAIIDHVGQKVAEGDDRYDEVELQVLFGSQEDLIDEGLKCLEGFDKDKVVVHVYDRVSSELRNLAERPYSAMQAADNVVNASKIAYQKGFRRFSVSGEGAVNHMDSLEETTLYYEKIVRMLDRMGANEVNANLANTFGLSNEGEWVEHGLSIFDKRVKSVAKNAIVTTSVHAHNDANTSTEFAMTCLEAGFDRVEGTTIGMGERAGNTALADVMVRLIEKARVTAETQDAMRVKGEKDRIWRIATQGFWNKRFVPKVISEALPGWYDACEETAETYQTQNRFHKTSLGNPEAYAAGSGPHAHANQEFLKAPAEKPLWRNYGTFAVAHAMMGRPDAIKVIEVDPERIKKITLDTHAAGGSTHRVRADGIKQAPNIIRDEAVRMAEGLMQRILIEMSDQPDVTFAEQPKSIFATA